MKVAKVILVLMCLAGSQVYALERVSTDWTSVPEKIKLDMEKWGDYSAVFLYNRIKSIYTGKGEIVQHTKVIHRRIRLLNEEAINGFNTLQIPYTKEFGISNFKARAIHADGTVTDIQKSDIEQASEGDMLLKLVAFENLQIGDDIEYYYEWEFPATIFSTVEFSTGLSTVQSYFEIEASPDIVLDLKSYNNVELYEDTTTAEGKHIVYAELRDLEEMEEELFSFPMRYSPRVEYSATLASQQDEDLSWDDFHPYKTTLNTPAYLKDRNLSKLIKEIPQAQDQEHLIYEADNYLKSEFEVVLNEVPGYRDIRTIMKSGKITGNEIGGLLAAIFTRKKIEFKMGYTTNRVEKEFDPDFLNSHNLQYLFFYFPKYKKYLLPSAPNLRYSFLPFQLTENKSILYDDKIDSKATVHYIPAKDSKLNAHNHNVKVSLWPSLDTVQIATTESLNGDSKSDALPALASIDKLQTKELMQDYVKSNEEDRLVDLNVENAEWSSFLYNKPVILKSKVNSTRILQPVAENEYLLNIGIVIGKQAELPRSSTKRKYDIDLSAPHSLVREIVLEVPPGYKVVNLSDLNMNKSLAIKGKEECYFRSSYTTDGNAVTVKIDEQYLTSHLPKSDYEAFREVINAAAEFNKLDLLISKQ